MLDPHHTEFAALADLIRAHARERPGQIGLRQGERQVSYATLDAMLDRVAASLQRDGLRPGAAIAICAASSMEYVAVFLGALRAGVVVAPLAPGSTPQSLSGMLVDAQAQLLFVDASTAPLFAAGRAGPPRIALDASAAPGGLESWLAPPGAAPLSVAIEPGWPFNIIYSSGTTGVPKGIVHSHAMRWAQVQRGARYGYGSDTITLLSTPLYSNTTLVVLIPTLAFGGTVVLMSKFDARSYLELAQRERVTHTMLVPVQYQRLMALSEFDAFDLSAFRFKFSTSAPFPATLKVAVLKRWPGALVEFYGLTEGGGTCILEAHVYPHKLHTVGLPAEGHDIRLIDEEGREVAPGAAGEVVGHSRGMMSGYHRQPQKTREAEWFDPSGKRFIRTGDIGRFDAEGFLVLIDRKKDMIISGGFNVYPSDLEAVLREHPLVADVAVVGVPSEVWGETPVAFVVRAMPGGRAAPAPDRQVPAPESLLGWANARLAKTQRIHELRYLAELPRSAIGKVLKRELREAYGAAT